MQNGVRFRRYPIRFSSSSPTRDAEILRRLPSLGVEELQRREAVVVRAELGVRARPRGGHPVRQRHRDLSPRGPCLKCGRELKSHKRLEVQVSDAIQ